MKKILISELEKKQILSLHNKKILFEEECIEVPEWLLNYELNGNKGNVDCSDFSWRKSTTVFLVINLKDKEIYLTTRTKETDEYDLENLKEVMGEPKVKNENYNFLKKYISNEKKEDLNAILDLLQSKIPWMNP